MYMTRKGDFSFGTREMLNGNIWASGRMLWLRAVVPPVAVAPAL